MGWLKVLQDNEEERLFWNPREVVETARAREKFAQYQRQGFMACKITGNGQSGVQINEFDPEAEEIFMLGLVDGG